jgi:hypothetical protein
MRTKMSLPSRISLLLLLSLVLFSGLAVAEGGSQDDGESVCKGDGPVEQGCPLIGNGDFYGLGVRVGICTSDVLQNLWQPQSGFAGMI